MNCNIKTKKALNRTLVGPIGQLLVLAEYRSCPPPLFFTGREVCRSLVHKLPKIVFLDYRI